MSASDADLFTCVIGVSHTFTLKTHDRNGINVELCLFLARSNMYGRIHKLLCKNLPIPLFRRDISNKNLPFMFNNSQNV